MASAILAAFGPAARPGPQAPARPRPFN
jgi:hypothetical protein